MTELKDLFWHHYHQLWWCTRCECLRVDWNAKQSFQLGQKVVWTDQHKCQNPAPPHEGPPTSYALPFLGVKHMNSL